MQEPGPSLTHSSQRKSQSIPLIRIWSLLLHSDFERNPLSLNDFTPNVPPALSVRKRLLSYGHFETHLLVEFYPSYKYPLRQAWHMAVLVDLLYEQDSQSLKYVVKAIFWGSWSLQSIDSQHSRPYQNTLKHPSCPHRGRTSDRRGYNYFSSRKPGSSMNCRKYKNSVYYWSNRHHKVCTIYCLWHFPRGNCRNMTGLVAPRTPQQQLRLGPCTMYNRWC